MSNICMGTISFFIWSLPLGDLRNMAAAQHGVATIILVTNVDPKSK